MCNIFLLNFHSLFFPSESLNNVKLEVGDYCACPSESEDWYRGIIRQLDSNGVAIVFKIDYGDIQIIPIKFLRPLQVDIIWEFLLYVIEIDLF